jgi:hypothetical protein
LNRKSEVQEIETSFADRNTSPSKRCFDRYRNRTQLLTGVASKVAPFSQSGVAHPLQGSTEDNDTRLKKGEKP